MFKFLAGRLVQMAILFVIFLTLIWFLLQAMPGDISDTLIGNPDIPLQTRLDLQERLGLTSPSCSSTSRSSRTSSAARWG